MATKPLENLHRMAKHIEMWLVDKLIPWARNPRTREGYSSACMTLECPAESRG
jgi:hypothetical protein